MIGDTIRIRGRRVVSPEGVVEATVVARNGTIAALEPYGSVSGAPVVDAGDAVVMPGVVDVHVHVDEPGRTEWEGFGHATRAAAAGGVTTIVDMPLNAIPPTTSVAALEAKAAAAEGACRVDYGFWGGVVPDNLDHLAPLLEAGVLGFKAFLADSGVEEFPRIGEEGLEAAMAGLVGTDAPLLVHAESQATLDEAFDGSGLAESPGRYGSYLASRPPEAEEAAVAAVVEACARTGARAHVVHVSASSTLPILERARRAGLAVTAETCPHYLTFDAGEIGDGRTLFKCAPPIREKANRERLWQGLRSGILDLVASDHSPCPPALRRIEEGDFCAAWGGIGGIELSLAAVWTEASSRGFGLRDLVSWLCEAPARLAGLSDRKGAIEVGRDADMVIWDPEASFEIEPEGLHSRHRWTPYEGRRLRGRVERTYLRGRAVYEERTFAPEPAGRWLRGRAAP